MSEMRFDFLQRANGLFKAYRDFPLPVVIANPQWKVYWSNDLARQYYTHVTTTQGLAAALEEFNREELLRQALEQGSCNLQDIFPLSGVNLCITPVLEEDKPWCLVLTFVRMDNLIDSKVFYRSTKLAGALSGGIREVMSDMFSALDTVSLKADLLNSAWMRDGLNTMAGSSYRMLRLAANLTEFGRYQSGLLDLRPRCLDLAGLLQSLEETTCSITASMGISATFSLPRQSLLVNLDRERFEVAFFNLLHNAAYYTRPGNHIDVKLDKHQGMARLTVEDRGLGIPPEVLPQVLQPYVSYGHGVPGKGLGLGLAVANLVAQTHDGTLELRSVHGRGTVVTLRLPLGEPKDTLRLEQPVDSMELTDRFSAVYVGLMDAALRPRRKE